MAEHLLLFLIALFANTLSALAGGGAGLLQLPALLFLGLAFSTALATHKIASVALGVGASLRHLRGEQLDPKLVLVLLGGGLPGVVLGASLVLSLPDALARLLLGLLTTGLGIYSLLRPQLGQQHRAQHRSRAGMGAGALGLFLIGILNGSLTSGTGLFVTIWLVRWFGLDYSRAVAYTLVLVGLFWNGFGALTLALQTTVQWHWLPALIAGSLLGGYLGAHWSQVRGNLLVKRCYELVTLLTGISLMYSGLMRLL